MMLPGPNTASGAELHRPLLDRELDAALDAAAGTAFEILGRGLAAMQASPRLDEVGRVSSVGTAHATVEGLPGVRLEELVRLGDGGLGMAFDLRPRELGVLLLGAAPGLKAGAPVRRTGRVLDVPVGEALLGRVVNALGQPIDEAGPLFAAERWPVERRAPPIIHRAPVEEPLQTGIKVIDALLPIGRGQRELIIGDRQTGKSAIALDAMIHQPDDVVCIYCAIGQRSAFVARLVADLEAHGALGRTVVVVGSGTDVPGLQYVAPYAATTMAEYFRDRGRDALIVYDDLTRHARAYRELSLLLRRPPGREAYPGDIFYVHSRLLERSTRLRGAMGGGSLTALPIVETQAQNLSAYIPTNLISITDGQIYVSPERFHRGILPAVDIGRSVSRVGGKAQRPALRALAARLRLDYAQFEELEEFSRFETRLDSQSRQALEHGRRVRQILLQGQYSPVSLGEQIALLLAVTEGVFSAVPVAGVAAAEERLIGELGRRHQGLLRRLDQGQPLDTAQRAALLAAAHEALGVG